jgi:release factor glutamine methyltransferase
MGEPRTWTLMEVLRWTAERFAGTSDTPRLDAELLLAEVLALGRVQLYTQFDRPLDPDELTRFKGLARRRIEGEPVAYIRGRRDFWGRSFLVDSRVMVPRPETELLVQGALDAAPEDEEIRVVDLCTGSGNVIISILEERPGWTGSGADLSADALAVASANRDAAELGDRLVLVEADLLDGVEPEPRPQIITANPPYVPDGDWAGLAPDVREYEPRGAITAGADGLDVIRRLLPAANAALAPGGTLLVEYDGRAQTPEIERLAADAGFEDITIVQDLAGLDRVLSARTPE